MELLCYFGNGFWKLRTSDFTLFMNDVYVEG